MSISEILLIIRGRGRGFMSTCRVILKTGRRSVQSGWSNRQRIRFSSYNTEMALCNAVISLGLKNVIDWRNSYTTTLSRWFSYARDFAKTPSVPQTWVPGSLQSWWRWSRQERTVVPHLSCTIVGTNWIFNSHFLKWLLGNGTPLPMNFAYFIQRWRMRVHPPNASPYTGLFSSHSA